MSLTTWTTEQMLGLAPDIASARAAEKFANPQEWGTLGRSESGIWGEFLAPNIPAYHVLATLPDFALTCDCPGRKRPCRHVLALCVLLARQPDLFLQQPPPDWTIQRLEDSKSRPADSDEDLADQVAAYEQQLQNVKRAMLRFQLWLKDHVHSGLAGLPSRPIAQWNEMASRLSDAGAPEIAAELRALRKVAGRRPGWPEEMLRRLGRFYLLTQAYAAYDSQSPAAQADLRSASGWFVDPAHPGDELLDGRWLVMGDAHQFMGNRNLRNSWLYGIDHHRFAFVQQNINSSRSQPTLLCETTLQASLRFTPGGWPHRATIESLQTISPAGAPVKDTDSLLQARGAYGKALSANPWLRRFPLVLRDVQSHLEGEQWVLRDRAGYALPLVHRFLYGWHLQVINRVHGSALFVEWDGKVVQPLSVFYQGRWLALRTLRGQK